MTHAWDDTDILTGRYSPSPSSGAYPEPDDTPLDEWEAGIEAMFKTAQTTKGGREWNFS